MGVVNATPDSFSDAGRFDGVAQVVAHARRLLDEGADILDIGGESTRPGAPEVSVQQELDRIGPVIEALRPAGVPLSVDTRKPPVMAAALAIGADMINDVAGFASPDAIEAVRAHAAGLCVMHMQGKPATMQQRPTYRDVVTDVTAFLAGQRRRLIDAGVAADRIVLDPGIGFGKTQEQNVELLRRLDVLREVGAPMLIGVSRKSLIGHLTGGRSVDERLAGSLAGAIAAVAAGAAIVRVHDVAQTRDALAVWMALRPSAED
ncbi:MAG: dihydropteroate synthase [Burkholderiaceae bacterium]